MMIHFNPRCATTAFPFSGLSSTLLFTALAAVVLQATPARAATGFFGDGTGGAIFYVTNGSTAGEGTYLNVGSLDETDFGDFIVGSSNLLLRGGEAKTFKNSGGDVYGVTQYYRIYEVGSTPGSFLSFALPFNADLGGGDQRWKKTDQNVNLVSGLTASGRYVVDYYWEQTGNQGTQYLSNGGANYQTYFDLNYQIDTSSTVTQAATGGAATLSGNGTFVKKGTGTVQINANNSGYTGNVFVDQGTLEFQAGSFLTSGSITLGPESSSATGALTISDSDGGTNVGNLIVVRANGAGSSLGATNTSGTNSYSGSIYLDGSASTSIAAGGTLSFNGTEIDVKSHTLTVDGAGSTSISANVISSTTSGTLTKSGTGTLTLSGSNTYTGATTINAGAIRASSATALGTTAGGVTVASGAALELSGGISIGAEALSLSGTGISSGGALRNISGSNTYGGAISLGAASRIQSDSGTLVLNGGISGTQNLTFGGAGDINVNSVIGTSTGSVTASGTGVLTLNATNTFSGGLTLSSGASIKAAVADSTVSGGAVTAGSFGTGAITINGGTIYGNSGLVASSDISIHSDFAINTGATGGINSRLRIAGAIDMEGATRTISLGRYSTASSILSSGFESLKFEVAAGGPTTSFSNGTIRFVRDAGGGASDYSAVRFESGAGTFTSGAGLTIGENIITTFGSSFAFNSSGNRPQVEVESGGYFNLSDNANVRSPLIRNLAGAGTVTSLASSTSTSILTILNEGGDSKIFSGQIVDGSSLTSLVAAAAAKMALTINGTGTQILSGANTYTGATTITAGTLQIGNGGTTGSLSTSSAITNNGALVFNRTNTITQGTDFAAVVGGTGALSQNGSGTLVLSGANTYSGATTINAGNVTASHATALGTTAAGTTVASGAALQLSGGIAIGAEALALSGNGSSNGGALRNLSGDNTYGGAITLNAASRIHSDAGLLILSGAIGGNTQNLTVGGAGNTTIGNVLGTTTGTLTKEGLGTLTLSASNTYSGATTITAGTLQIASGGRLGSGNYAGSISNSGAFVFESSNTQTLSGILSGTGSLANNGTGTLILSGTNTFSGGLTLASGASLRGGTINAAASGGAVTSSAFGTGTITINGGTIYGNSGLVASPDFSIHSDFAVNSGATGTGLNARLRLAGAIDMEGGTRSVSLGRYSSDPASLLVSGSESLKFEILANGPATSFSNGTIRFVRDSAGGAGDYSSVRFDANTGVFNSGAGLVIGSNVITVLPSSFVFSDFSNRPQVEVESGGYFNLSDNTNARDAAFRNLSGAGTVTSLATGGASALTLNMDASDSKVFSGQIVDGSSLTALVAGANTTVSLTLFGSGTQIFTGANTYTGATTIAAGTLQIGSGSTTGSLSASSAITNNGTLVFNRSNAVSQGTDFSSSAISGTGSITQNGSNSLTLNAANTYSGGTTLNSGTLVIGNASGAGSGTVTQSSGSSLLTIDTTGTVANTMSLYNVLARQTATLSGAITVNNATFDIEDGDTLTISSTIDGTGGVTKNGTGTLVLSGSNTYSGATTVNAGILDAANANALGANATVTVNGGSLLVSADDAIKGKSITLYKSIAGDASASQAALAFDTLYSNTSGTAGALTLSQDSIIDLGTGGVVVHFASIANLNSYILHIFNWEGDSVWSGSPGGGKDQFYVDSNLSSTQLGNIRFYSGTTTSSFLSTGFQILGGDFNQEIIAVPEPETYATGLLLLLGLGLHARRQIRRRRMTT